MKSIVQLLYANKMFKIKIKGRKGGTQGGKKE
jgi:hypothetical protein